MERYKTLLPIQQDKLIVVNFNYQDNCKYPQMSDWKKVSCLITAYL